MLPGPVIQLHVTSVTDDSVVLAWQPPTDAGVVHQYIVHFATVDQSAAKSSAFELDEQLNVTEPIAHIHGLKSKQLYNFFVLAANEYGTSLPSSILTVNVTKEGITMLSLCNRTRKRKKLNILAWCITALTDGNVTAVPSAPQAISVSSRSANYLTISWQQPKLVHPTDRLSYKYVD